MPTTVMLVDGNLGDATLIRAALGGTSSVASFHVVVAESLTEAASMLAEREIECVLLDLGLLGGIGVDDVDAMVAMALDVPVVALTPTGANGLGKEAVLRGADDYIAKSEIDGSRLDNAIRHATQRAGARSGMRDLARHLRNVLDSLAEGVIVRSVNGDIVTVNDRAEAILGVATDSWRDEGYSALSDRPIFNEDGTRCGADDLPSSVALRTLAPVIDKVLFLERPDGKRLWIQCTATLLRSDADGSVSGVITSMRDLTDRRNAEESLRFRSTLLDAVGQAVVATDLEGKVIYWNRAAEATYGWTEAEAIGVSAEILLPSDASRETAADIFEAIVEGRTWTGEFHVGRRDGSTFLAWVSDTPVFDDDGDLIAIIGVSADMTELHDADDALRLQAALLGAVGQSVVATDVDNRVVYWNAAAAREFGWSEEEILGRDASSTLAHETRLEFARGLEQDLIQGQSWTGDLLMRRRDGSVFTASVSTSPMTDDDDEVVTFIAVMADVTERREAEESNRRLSAIIESTGDAVIGESLECGIVTWNTGAERLLGYSADEAIGQSCTMFIPSDRLDEFTLGFSRAAEGIITEGLESVRQRKDGSLVDVSLTLSPWRDSDGCITGVSTIARDISERKRMERAIVHQALHDALTGLPNRTLLVDRMNQALVGARRRERRLAVLFLDLDNFKVLNDAQGHPSGDAVLVELADRLRVIVRPGDTVARFGGDEFVVLCEANHVDTPLALAERLLQVVTSPIDLGGQSHALTTSIGVALSDDESSVDSLLRDSGAAMHQAKAEGRACIRLFEPEIHERATARLAAPAELRRALDNDEFRVFFQPIVSVADERLRGFEALVRWQHPERGFIPPLDFIGEAEETGLIVQLGEHVLRCALAEAKRWALASDVASPPFISVNLSARQLAEEQLPIMIAAAIDEFGVPADRLTLEVTESVVMDDVAHSISSLRALRDIGVRVSVDDFGTGYSSLSYLKQLPVDALKIDRSFVNGLGEDRHDSAIVEAIIALARTLDLGVVAEGVETRQQRDELRNLNCDLAQGFLWSQAVPADEAFEWVQRGRPRSATG